MKNNIFLLHNRFCWNLFFIFFSSLILCAKSHKKPDEINLENRNIQFFQKVISNKSGLFFEGFTWIKNGKICVEFEENGNLYTSLIIKNKVYEFSTLSSQGKIKTIDSKKNAIFSSDFFSSEKKLERFLKKRQAKKLKEEIYENETCSVYQYKKFQNNQKIIHTMWIWKKAFFPLKIEIIFEKNEKISIFYDNIVINAEIPDKRFFIPKNVHFKKWHKGKKRTDRDVKRRIQS